MHSQSCESGTPASSSAGLRRLPLPNRRQLRLSVSHCQQRHAPRAFNSRPATQRINRSCCVRKWPSFNTTSALLHKQSCWPAGPALPVARSEKTASPFQTQPPAAPSPKRRVCVRGFIRRYISSSFAQLHHRRSLAHLARGLRIARRISASIPLADFHGGSSPHPPATNSNGCARSPVASISTGAETPPTSRVLERLFNQACENESAAGFG